jgi:hypothetical protein
MAQSLVQRRNNIRKLVKNMFIDEGGHAREEGQCVMEAVSLVTTGGDIKTDRPEAACSSITNMMITINDRINDDDRQLLKKLVPYIAWTNDGKAQSRQKRILQTFMCIAASKAKRKDEKAMYRELARCIKNDNMQKAVDLLSYENDDPDIKEPAYLGKYEQHFYNDYLLKAFSDYRKNGCENAGGRIGGWWLDTIGDDSASVKLFVQMMVRILDKPLYSSKALYKRLQLNYRE